MARSPKQPEEPDDSETVRIAGGLHAPRLGGRISAEDVRAAVEAAREIYGEEGLDDEQDAALRTVRFDVRHDLRKRLDKYLVDRIDFLSRNQVQKLIDDAGVLINGKPPKSSTEVRQGDIVTVVVPLPPPKNIQPEDIPLDVLYEDQHIIVINKQPDIIVHPARSHLKGTMLSALEFHFRHRSTTGGNLSKVGDEFARPGVVHRLDRHTSGCIVFAKNDEAHWKIGHQFEHRQVDKRYMALVHGRIEPVMDVIDLPLGPHPSKEKGFREKVVVRHDDQGRNAVTIYRVREVYDMRKAPPARAASPVLGWNPASIEAPVVTRRKDPDVFTLVELELKTGRTHQIRVHLSHNDWPIVGDDMYGGRPYVDAAGVTLMNRQALHATLLSFRHPVTEEKMTFTAPLRGDLAATVRSLRASSEHYIFTPPGATVDLAQVMKHIE